MILTQEKRFKTREQLANHLGVGLSSLNRWTKNYQENGLEAMLAIKSGGNQESKISDNAEFHSLKKFDIPKNIVLYQLHFRMTYK